MKISSIFEKLASFGAGDIQKRSYGFYGFCKFKNTG